MELIALLVIVGFVCVLICRAEIRTYDKALANRLFDMSDRITKLEQR